MITPHLKLIEAEHGMVMLNYLRFRYKMVIGNRMKQKKITIRTRINIL